jgi:hypothetical protein
MRSSTLLLRQVQDEVLFVTPPINNLILSPSKDEPAKGNPDA